MVQSKSNMLELNVGGRDYAINQSPGLLRSDRQGGTTGAAIWRTSVCMAEWLAWDQNPLFRRSVLGPTSVALEMGSGVSGLVPLVMSRRIRRSVATDQEYVLKILRENIETNYSAATAGTLQKSVKSKERKPHKSQTNIDVLSLDWEQDDVPSVLTVNGLEGGVDCIVACDCIYNYALIEPFVRTCQEIAELRVSKADQSGESGGPTIILIAQQLRQPEVIEEWLEATLAKFRIWRVPSNLLVDSLKEGTGYVVHIGMLRGSE